MKGCVIFFLDFRYNFLNICDIISKSFATYECCHSCSLMFIYSSKGLVKENFIYRKGEVKGSKLLQMDRQIVRNTSTYLLNICLDVKIFINKNNQIYTCKY